MPVKTSVTAESMDRLDFHEVSDQISCDHWGRAMSQVMGLPLLVVLRETGFLKWTAGGESNDGHKDHGPPLWDW